MQSLIVLASLVSESAGGGGGCKKHLSPLRVNKRYKKHLSPLRVNKQFDNSSYYS